MAIAEWPPEVSLGILRQGFGEVDDDTVEKFQPEKGPEITWDSPSTTTTVFRITVPCNLGSKEILTRFYRANKGKQFRRPIPSSPTGEIGRFKFMQPIAWSEVFQNSWHGSTSIRRMP